MLHITENKRAWNWANIVALMVAIIRSGFAVRSPLALIKGKKGICNLVDTLKAIRDQIKPLPGAKLKILDSEYTWDSLLDKCAVWENQQKGKFPCVCDGRHRGVAYMLACVFGYSGEYHSFEVVESAADVEAFEGNTANDYVTRLENEARLREALALIESGKYQKQCELPFKHGVNQRVWAQARLIREFGTAFEDAVKLTYPLAAECLKAREIGPAEAARLKAAEKATGGNVQKVLDGKKIRILSEKASSFAAMSANKEVMAQVAKLLDGIVRGSELDAEQALLKLAGDMGPVA
jgi:hypothetical protein